MYLTGDFLDICSQLPQLVKLNECYMLAESLSKCLVSVVLSFCIDISEYYIIQCVHINVLIFTSCFKILLHFLIELLFLLCIKLFNIDVLYFLILILQYQPFLFDICLLYTLHLFFIFTFLLYVYVRVCLLVI